MMQDHVLHAVSAALRNPAALEFVRTSIKAGYVEYFDTANDQVCEMVDTAFEQLAQSQQAGVNPAQLVRVTNTLLEHAFRKSDPSFWFNRVIANIKRKPNRKATFSNCRNRLARGGYEVFTADVLNYGYEEARRLPFMRMASPTDIPCADDSVDVALVQAVLHHINPP
jgi:hypothetical protein